MIALVSFFSGATRRRRRWGRAALLGALVWLAGLTGPVAAQLSASVDRRIVDENDLVVLEITRRDGSLQDLDALRRLEDDFEIVGTPRRASRIVIARGETQGVSSLSVQLQPKRRGTLVIPALRFDGEQTEPITVTVVAPRPEEQRAIDQAVFFETEVSDDEVRVQQQILYTMRLYYAADAVLFGNLPPAPEIDSAIVQPLGESRPGTEVRDGRRYNLVEQRYAVVPQRSGSLRIPPETFTGAVRMAVGDTTRRKNVRIGSEGHVIQVRARPETWPAGVPWLPARSLSLTRRIEGEPETLRVGEPVTRILELEATGVAASALPDLDPPPPGNARVYPSRPELAEALEDGAFVARRSQSAVLIPSRPGPLTLPRLRIDWWDTAAEAMRTAEVPAVTLRVEPAETAAPTTADVPPGSALVPASPGVAPTPAATGEAAQTPWRSIAAVLLVLWLLTLGGLVLLWRRRRRTTAEHEATPQETDGDDLLHRVEQCCRTRDARGVRAALGQWVRHVPSSTPGHAAAQDLLAELDRQLYGPDRPREPELAGVRDWLRRHRAAAHRQTQAGQRPDPALPPLYPPAGGR